MRIFSVTKWVCAAAFLTVAVFHADAATVTTGLTIYSPGLEKGLIGHWTFDGKDMVSNVADSSGLGNTGRLVFGATGSTATTTLTGPIGQALQFDGLSDYINAGVVDGLGGSTGFSVSAWVNTNTLTGGDSSLREIVSQSNTFSSTTFVLRLNTTSDYIEFIVGGTAGYSGTANSGANSIVAGRWYHVVGVYDGANLQIYLNGTAAGSPVARTLVVGTDAAELHVGNAWRGGINDRYWSGAVDDVRVYNRVLTPNEIKRLYILGAGMRFGTTPTPVNTGLGTGLVGHWTFDGKNLISNAADTSGQGKHGALRSNTGGQTATTTAPGVLGQGLVFDGTDDWIHITDTTDPTAYTISAWVKPVDVTSVSIFTRASSGSLPTSAWSHQLAITSGGKAYHYLYDGAGQSVTGTSDISPGVWYHIVGTAQNSGSMKLYVNGVEEGTPDTVGTMWTGGDRWYPGTNTGGSMGYYNGVLDDVRLYSRVLTLAEIKRLYVMGVGTRITPPVAANSAPIPSDAGRNPGDAADLGGVTSLIHSVTEWTDPEGDDIEYYFERWTGNTTCAGASAENSGWLTDPSLPYPPGGWPTAIGNDINYSWKVKARDEHGLESGYNTCYWFISSGGSCPYTFGWDGKKFSFEVDIFGSGGLGYKKWGLDEFVQPAPNRTYALTNAVPKGGVFEWRIVGDLVEIDYFDYFRLYSVFIPKDRDIIVESPTLGSGAGAKSILHTVSTAPILPVRAVWLDTNEDVTEKLSARDEQKVILNEDREETYEYEMIEVDFGDISQYPTKKLIIGGSTTYPRTDEGIARKQLFGKEWGLYVQNTEGKWQKVPYEKYSPTKPLSFDSVIAVDISDIFISENTKLRLEYLYKVYVDYVALDVTEDIPVTVAEEHPIIYADLHDFGGWHDFDKDGNVPDYYDVVALEKSFKDFPGYYTKFGNVIPLLTERDDKFVIMAKADEVTVKNSGPKLLVPDGYKRVVMLDVTGYYKALGKTKTSLTVEPMPFSGMSAFPYPDTEHYPDTPEYQAYLSEWNTRYLSPEKSRGGNGLLGGVEKLLEDLQNR